MNRQKWLPYVRKIADLMDLKQWEIIIHNDPPASHEFEASCFIPEGRRICNLYLSESFLNNTPESQRATIIHELQHCHMNLFEVSIKKVVDHKQWSILETLMELCIDDTANYVSKLFPLPPKVK